MQGNWTSKVKMSIMAKRMVAKREALRGSVDDFLRASSTETPTELFYDDFLDIYFYSTKVSVLGAELALNRELNMNGRAHLTTFYDILIPDRDYPDEYKKYIWDFSPTLKWIDVEHIWIDESPFPDDNYCNYHMLIFTDLPVLISA